MENKQKEKKEEQEVRDSGYYDKRPDFMNRKPSKSRQTWERGKIYFFVLAAGILFYFALLRLTNLSGIALKIVDVLKPIIYGIAIAYILNPLVNFIDRYLHRLLKKWIKTERNAQKISKGISILISMLLVISIFIGLFNMVIPELYRSIRNLVITLPRQLEDILTKINSMDSSTSTTNLMIKNIFTEVTGYIQTWLSTDLLKQVNTIMSDLTEGVFEIISTLFNILIGMIVAVYLLFSKETFSAQGKKMLYAFTKPKYANMVLHVTRKSNDIFGGYIAGVITDAAIVGILCFLGMSLLKMPYALLISVVIGATNIIPYFGPYIGAIPSATLILLNSPQQGIYFIIFILVIQQIDGNIIAPKILGNSTGLSSFWVIVATLLGGGMFGIIGMVMGVPSFAVIYYLVQTIINQKLEKKNLPAHSKNYTEKSYVNNAGTYMGPDES